MRKLKSLIAFLFVLNSTLLLGQTQKNAVYFEKDKYELTQTSKNILDSVANSLIIENDYSTEIKLIGYTDIDANDSYNLELSRKRTLEVYHYLISKGVMNQFELVHKGEKEPVNSSKDELEKSVNRRVEISQQKKNKNYVYDVFDEKVQEFEINPERDTMITCQKGTKIKIDKLIFKNTNLFKPITVRVQEYNTMNDYVLNNLTTKMPNGTFLESRGMINLEIKQGENDLELKPNKNVEVLFKDRKLGDNTNLFYGERNGDLAVWHEDNSSTSTLNSYSIWGYSYLGKTITKIITAEEAKKRGIQVISEWKLDTINNEPCRLIINYDRNYNVTSRDTVFVENEELMSSLMIKSAKFGLINCDRFTKNTNPRMELMVEANGLENANVILAFDDIKAMLPYSYREGNKYYFTNIPEQLNARVVGLNKSSKDTDISFASKKIITEREKPIQITFEKKTKEEIELLMKEI